jgi:peptide/nickel transport system ATP-binding protein
MRHPYTEALLNSIPKIANPSHTRLDAIAGRPPDLINPPKGCNFAPRCRYAQDHCRTEEPPLIPSGTAGHEYRCWFPVGTPEGRQALAYNQAREATSPATAVDVPTVPSVPPSR